LVPGVGRRKGRTPGPPLYPGVTGARGLVGVASRTDLEGLVGDRRTRDFVRPLGQVVRRHPTVAYPDEPLRSVVYRMAESGLTRFPVVERHTRRLLGMVGLFDLLELARPHA